MNDRIGTVPRGRRLQLLVAGLLMCIPLLAACNNTYAITKSHEHTVDYDDPAELAEARRQLDLLKDETISRGYRLASTVRSTDGSGTEQTTVLMVGKEPGLGEVELQLESWDRLRPDQPEVRVHVSAQLPPRREGEVVPAPPEWTDMLDRIRLHLYPRYF